MKGQTIIKINSDEVEAFLRQSRSQFQNQIASFWLILRLIIPKVIKNGRIIF